MVSVEVSGDVVDDASAGGGERGESGSVVHDGIQRVRGGRDGGRLDGERGIEDALRPSSRESLCRGLARAKAL